jgi:hypothetical protein
MGGESVILTRVLVTVWLLALTDGAGGILTPA